MRLRNDRKSKATPETKRRYDVMEMHLFDENASREEACCGAASETDCLRAVSGYLEDRLYGNSVGVICEACMALTVPFAVNRARDLEAEGRWDEAEEYRQLADTLLRETGLGHRSG
ncbi:MAG: hypothetical protein OXC99_03025 [Chloroflexi bacterium]|nr:hypothetical protein [Chloroflexota bacterium]